MKRIIINESQLKLIKENHLFDTMIRIAHDLATHHGGAYFGESGEKLKKAYSSDGKRTGLHVMSSAVNHRGENVTAKLGLDEYGVVSIILGNKSLYERPEHIKNMIQQSAQKQEPPVEPTQSKGPEGESLQEEFLGVLSEFNKVIKMGRLIRLQEIEPYLKNARDYQQTMGNANSRNENIIEYLFNRFFGSISDQFNNEMAEIDRRSPKDTTIYIFNQKLKELGAENKAYLYGEPINYIVNGTKVKPEFNNEEIMDQIIEFYYENLP